MLACHSLTKAWYSNSYISVTIELWEFDLRSCKTLWESENNVYLLGHCFQPKEDSWSSINITYHLLQREDYHSRHTRLAGHPNVIVVLNLRQSWLTVHSIVISAFNSDRPHTPPTQWRLRKDTWRWTGFVNWTWWELSTFIFLPQLFFQCNGYNRCAVLSDYELFILWLCVYVGK